MKKAILFLSCTVISLGFIQAQQDVFKKYGHKKEILTLSKGKYQEVFKNKELVQIGTVLLNTKTNKIIKLLQEDTTKTSYKSEFSSRFLTIDPLAEKYPWQSPYAFCSNNPVNKIDPDGRADFWLNGKVIGNDGVDNTKIYFIKTTEKSFGSEENNSKVNGAGLSRADMKSTVKFITDNNGNAEAFQKNGMAYTNSIEIEGSSSARQDMVNGVSKDNGNGGTTDANNREYGGNINNGNVTTATPGAVANPSVDATASIMVSSGTSFHSHPSGTVVIGNTSANTIGGTTTTYSFNQHPSPPDVRNAGNTTHYVFGRGNNQVYIYNSAGVQAVVPMRYFVTPKK